MVDTSGTALLARAPVATRLYTKLTGDGRVLVTLYVPQGTGFQVYSGTVAKALSNEIVQVFDPDESIRGDALHNAELCLSKH